MFLEHMSYVEVSEYLKKSDSILIPVGSLENHGKHMPLGTDTMIPNEIARLLSEKSDIVIAPTVNYAATDDLVGFPGTVSLGVDGLIWLLNKIIDQLFSYGFRHFLILNGHGGNSKSIDSCGIRLYRKGGILANMNWWLMAGQMNPEWAGGHGGGEETAAVMAIDPTLIKTEYLDLPENVKDDLQVLPSEAWTSTKYKGVTIQVPRPINKITDNGWLAHGVANDPPTKATEEWGKAMLRSTADYMAEFIEVFKQVPLPLPENQE